MTAADIISKFRCWVEGEEYTPSALDQKRETRPHKPEVSKKSVKKPSLIAKIKQWQRVYSALAVLVCLCMAFVLLLTVSWLPKFGGVDNPAVNEVYERYVEKGLDETGAVNTVAGMILDYRAFDTLGESNVLFIAVCSVIILLRADRKPVSGEMNIAELEHCPADRPDDPVLKGAALLIVPAGFVFGIYVILNGHLSAGGGFSGGAIIGACMILYANSWGSEGLEKYFSFSTYKWITFAALISYTLLKSYSFYTGANGLESGIPLGKPGAILSSGLILPLNICVGMVVACTMYAFYSLFKKGGFGNGQ